MSKHIWRKYDKAIGIGFAVLTVILILVLSGEKAFNWAFDRHHNQLSWYIRPLFLIPFCYFAYKRSWGGIMGTIFALISSMFWFAAPETVSTSVKEFLAFEKEWLTGSWSFSKVLMTLLVPASFAALGTALWKRSLKTGLMVVAFMAVGKMLWSVAFGGESGKSIMVPAVLGLVLCIGLIYWGFKKMEKSKRKK